MKDTDTDKKENKYWDKFATERIITEKTYREEMMRLEINKKTIKEIMDEWQKYLEIKSDSDKEHEFIEQEYKQKLYELETACGSRASNSEIDDWYAESCKTDSDDNNSVDTSYSKKSEEDEEEEKKEKERKEAEIKEAEKKEAEKKELEIQDHLWSINSIKEKQFYDFIKLDRERVERIKVDNLKIEQIKRSGLLF